MSRVANLFSNKNKTGSKSVPNVDGGAGFERPDKEAYLQVLMTNVMGHTFYKSQAEQVDAALKAHEYAVANFPDFMGKAAVYARNKGYMRSQPVLAMAYLAVAKHPGFAKYFEQVCLTPNDLVDFMEFYTYLSGKQNQGGRSFKRVIGEWLVHKLNPFWVVKYGSEHKKGYSLRNLMITMHPRGVDKEVGDYIVNKKIPQSEGASIIAEFEKLKRVETAEEALEIVKRGRLPHEVVTPFTGRFPELWGALVNNMPVQALMMSLNALSRKNALRTPENVEKVKSVFGDQEKIEKSKLLPFQFINAYDAVVKAHGEDWVLDALRKAVDLSVDNIPENMSRTVVALDVSGSMKGDFLRIASVIGLALARKSAQCRFYTFSNNLNRIHVSKLDSILTQAEHIYAGGGTSTNLPVEEMIKDYHESGTIADTLILITDGAQNNGRPFYEAVTEYRKTCNGNLKLFLVDVGSYSEDGKSIPESKLNWTLVGWSPKVLDFMLLAMEGYDSMMKYIESL